MNTTSSVIPLRILLIEDSKGDVILIEKALQQAMPGTYHIDTANTLAGATKMLAENEFDIALLDRSLPDAVDYTGLQRIQSIAPKLPVVYLTAYKDDDLVLESVKLGAQDYLIKDKVDGQILRRAIQFAVIRKQFENMLILQANFDNMTGLANRMLFENRLDMALAKTKRYGGGIGVMFLDLNRFKDVNDHHGHAVGDRLLTEVGQRLKSCLRPYDTAARLGGDEFAVLLESGLTIHHCSVIAKRMIQAVEKPFIASGISLQVGLSVGIATCVTGQAATRAELMQQADKAMYAAKSSRESSYVFFSNNVLNSMEAPVRMQA